MYDNNLKAEMLDNEYRKRKRAQAYQHQLAGDIPSQPIHPITLLQQARDNAISLFKSIMSQQQKEILEGFPVNPIPRKIAARICEEIQELNRGFPRLHKRCKDCTSSGKPAIMFAVSGNRGCKLVNEQYLTAFKSVT